MPVLSPAEAETLAAAALEANRVAPVNAESVARALVAAELTGQAGHGLRRVLSYAAQAKSGKVDGHAAPRAERVRPGALLVDAASGFAYPALDRACADLPAMVRDQGIAIAGIARSHHAGAVGQVVERLAGDGLVAMMFANSPAAMAPWGARRALFGTNPIAFACPLGGDAAPIVVDLSLSRVARGKLMAAAQKGEPIPEGWALDPEGRPTTDPAAGMAGTMAPLGDAKGTALALMVELLSAGLTGSNYAYEASSFFEGEGAPPHVGQSIIAIDPALFADGTARFAAMAAEIAGAEGARLPGRRRQELRARLEAEGISVDAALIAEIQAIT